MKQVPVRIQKSSFW